MQKQISIALVDDDNLVVSLLSSFFEEHGVSVLIRADNGMSFLQALQTLEAPLHVVILDLRMKEMDGLQTLEVLKSDFPYIKVIVLSSYYNESSIGFMLKAGVNAFLPKGILPEQLLEVVREVVARDFYFTSQQVEALKNQIPDNASVKPSIAREDQITKRELEVLELICLQYTAKEIGEKLFITQRTVEGHRNSLLLKTGVKNTAGLVIYAVREKLFDPNKLLLF